MGIYILDDQAVSELRTFVDQAVAKLYSEGFQFGTLRPSLSLTTSQVHDLESCVTLLNTAEGGTAVLGRDHSTSTLRSVQAMARDLTRRIMSFTYLRFALGLGDVMCGSTT